ncbi:MAG: DNA methyltransferase, partial [Bradymonadales bacterium]
FAERLETPEFNASMRQTLIDCALFDWSVISPAIFGAMFQGVLDPEVRRNFGAHYTSEENILKLINPLFMDELWQQFDKVKADPRLLEDLHQHIASLRLLDPACGCGNFLIIAYRELRKLEHAIIKMKRHSRQRVLDAAFVSRLRVDQFYGIEIEEFPCQIANVALWLMDHLMNLELSEILGHSYARLPLTGGAHIVHGNALQIDWQTLLGDKKDTKFDYIIGNPPFVGARMMLAEQKSELFSLFEGVKNAGNLDYVCCWLKKAADLLQNTKTRAAFVATNSIAQGEQAAILWEHLFAKGIFIDFAYRSFKWSNEAKGKAAVHCVIVGYSQQAINKAKFLFDEAGNRNEVQQINGYLIDAPLITVSSRNKALCDVPSMGIGNKPIDNGNYLFKELEMLEFIKTEPESAAFFRPWVGAYEFINRVPRYCLWLGDCTPKQLRQMPECLKRVEAVRNFRLASKSLGTRKIAQSPTRFHVENMPTSDYIIVPRVSSENRHYIPIGFMHSNVIASDAVLIIPNATLYHFGILTSSVHMAWMRTVCGRLEMRYRYSKDIVYNNFPWPELSAAHENKVSALAQKILDTRARYPESSLADLYDSNAMPADLLKAHEALNKAVFKLYGFNLKASEAEIVASLMRRYAELSAA